MSLNVQAVLKHLNVRVRRSPTDVDDSDADDVVRANLLEQILAHLDAPQKTFLARLQATGADQWQSTDCAKRIFCDVMAQYGDDVVAVMHKRMTTFLTL